MLSKAAITGEKTRKNAKLFLTNFWSSIVKFSKKKKIFNVSHKKNWAKYWFISFQFIINFFPPDVAKKFPTSEKPLFHQIFSKPQKRASKSAFVYLFGSLFPSVKISKPKKNCYSYFGLIKKNLSIFMPAWLSMKVSISQF